MPLIENAGIMNYEWGMKFKVWNKEPLTNNQ